MKLSNPGTIVLASVGKSKLNNDWKVIWRYCMFSLHCSEKKKKKTRWHHLPFGCVAGAWLADLMVGLSVSLPASCICMLNCQTMAGKVDASGKTTMPRHCMVSGWIPVHQVFDLFRKHKYKWYHLIKVAFQYNDLSCAPNKCQRVRNKMLEPNNATIVLP